MGKTQTTVKAVEEALLWIHTNAHHEVGFELKPTEPNFALATHFYLKNHHFKLRIPAAIHGQMAGLIESNKRPFDTRMYALTQRGKRRLYKSAYGIGK